MMPENELDAEEQSRVACPECGALWSEEERVAANTAGRLLHDGQEVAPGGEITGTAKRTRTLSVRYNCANNVLVEDAVGVVGVDEWKASKLEDEGARENAEKELLQWCWAMPFEPKTPEVVPLSVGALITRVSPLKRGQLPPDTIRLAVGADIRMRELHYTTIAQRSNGQCSILDYGIEPIAADSMGFDEAFPIALGNLTDNLRGGYLCTTMDENGDLIETGETMAPERGLIDSGYEDEAIYSACKTHDLWMPCKGFGHQQLSGKRYTQPKKRSREVRFLGLDWHISVMKMTWVVSLNADAWKGDASPSGRGTRQQASGDAVRHGRSEAQRSRSNFWQRSRRPSSLRAKARFGSSSASRATITGWIQRPTLWSPCP